MDYSTSDVVNKTTDDKAVFAGKWCLVRENGEEVYAKVFVRAIEDGIVSFHYAWDADNCHYADAEMFFGKRDIRLCPPSMCADSHCGNAAPVAAAAPNAVGVTDGVIVEFTSPTIRGFERTNFTLGTDKVDEWLKKVGSKTSWADIKDSVEGGYRVILDLRVPNSWNIWSVELSRIGLPKVDDEPNSFVSKRRLGETVSVQQ